jgi:hypothetical protein
MSGSGQTYLGRDGTVRRPMNVTPDPLSERGNSRGYVEPLSHPLQATIVGMYREMPGLSLHLAQAARLFGVGAATCQAILDDLVRQGQLRRANDGQYTRA